MKWHNSFPPLIPSFLPSLCLCSKPDRAWEVDLGDLERQIDSNTAAIIVNNPSNPCGSCYSEQHLKDILSIAEKHRKPIIVDETYAWMVS